MRGPKAVKTIKIELPIELADNCACLFRAALWAQTNGESEMARTIHALERIIEKAYVAQAGGN
jgi:hypothetical protein